MLASIAKPNHSEGAVTRYVTDLIEVTARMISDTFSTTDVVKWLLQMSKLAIETDNKMRELSFSTLMKCLEDTRSKYTVWVKFSQSHRKSLLEYL